VSAPKGRKSLLLCGRGEWAFWAQYEDIFQDVWRKVPHAWRKIEDQIRQVMAGQIT
jgi:hypothetical protein